MSTQIASLPQDPLRNEENGAHPFSLLHDAGGEITALAIRIVENMFSLPELHDANDNLLKALAQGSASLVAVTGASLVVDTETWLRNAGFAGRYQICPIPDDEFKGSAVWPRDCLLCGTKPDGSAMAVVAKVSMPVNDLGEWLTSWLPLPNIEISNVWLDGGDSLVVDDTCWIVGANAVTNTIEASNSTLDWDQAVKRIADANGGREPIIAGFDPSELALWDRWTFAKMRVRGRGKRRAGRLLSQPKFPKLAEMSTRFFAFGEFLKDLITPPRLAEVGLHADMVISVTGRRRNDRPLILVGDPTLPGGPANIAPEYRQNYTYDVRVAKQGLDKTVEGLKAKGFEVERNPTPFFPPLVMLPYNNVIVQTNPDIVWLPVFATDTMDAKQADDANIAIWRCLGYEVKTVPGSYGFAESDGCIRCATLALQRKPTPPVRPK